MSSNFEYFGTCPNVGDTIISEDATGLVFYSVQRRCFIHTSDSEQGWAVIVRRIESTPVMVRLCDAWLEDTRFWRDLDEKERAEEQAASMARLRELVAERSKKPPSRVDRRVIEVLKVIGGARRPLVAVNIPRCGERTVELLLGMGLVLQTGETSSGQRLIKITEEGRKEVAKVLAWEKKRGHTR